jgi:hypothetical protein
LDGGARRLRELVKAMALVAGVAAGVAAFVGPASRDLQPTLSILPAAALRLPGPVVSRPGSVASSVAAPIGVLATRLTPRGPRPLEVSAADGVPCIPCNPGDAENRAAPPKPSHAPRKPRADVLPPAAQTTGPPPVPVAPVAGPQAPSVSVPVVAPAAHATAGGDTGLAGRSAAAATPKATDKPKRKSGPATAPPSATTTGAASTGASGPGAAKGNRPPGDKRK